MSAIRWMVLRLHARVQMRRIAWVRLLSSHGSRLFSRTWQANGTKLTARPNAGSTCLSIRHAESLAYCQ